ncbi:Protein kinase C-like phorbol ester/diacylglycerol-binding domain [Arabidopsis suecica]|uniref:Protein kinase C-like phorbol ester/diacylglycerol-binding domain n=1 Tax=Arabidopsis suecica TaxID=45249 RepID=A0A8T1ZRC5_ARASU|nr:Protein kinase C-like phorbol ester/diacylglycerol-binding domain [Arabidopsis suecica]
MSLIGEFHKGEIDGKPYLLYHQVIKPLPQINFPDEETTIEKPLSIQNKTYSSDKLAIDSGDDLPLFVCPVSRIKTTIVSENIILVDEDGNERPGLSFKLTISPLVGDNLLCDHVVLPLFWCNNKEVDPENDCGSCRAPKVGTYYYFCVTCDERYHKECVESPLEINYPYHVKHSLQLYFSNKDSNHCILCTEKADYDLYYYSSLSDIYMHVLCAQTPIPFFIDQPKRHDHTLNLFPRQASLTCNVCALVHKHSLTYVCTSCDFVAHSDCIHIPQTIRISRHYHRVSFTSFLQPRKWSCGVCRKQVDHDYGAYTCNVCSGYAVHTRCALRKDISDGIELEGLPEEEKDVEPFERISAGVILHFSHGCHLKFGTSGVYDENKFCQACTLSINEENFYVCVECDFMLHERCAYAPRKKVHPLHPHPLEQKSVHERLHPLFRCVACFRVSNGFKYECANKGCDYTLDVVCASASEPFDYQGHQHPLFLALDPQEKPLCHICKSTEVQNVLNCIEFQCDFIICFKCATLPYMVRYKHDEHYLTFCRGDEASGSDWCELCEGKLAIGGKEGFYKCNDCCTTLHINCLLGLDPYLKACETFPGVNGGEVLIQRNNSATRPICGICESRCQYPTFILRTKDMESYSICTINHP